MKILRVLRRYLALRPSERRLVWSGFFWLGAMSLSLRTLGFRRVLRFVTSRTVPSSTGATEHEIQRAVQYGRWLEKVARVYLLPAHCLERSLVLHTWLHREGLPSVLQIGVCKEGDALKAHAWVELHGQLVNDQRQAVAAFQPLVRWVGGTIGQPAPVARSADPHGQPVASTHSDAQGREQHRG